MLRRNLSAILIASFLSAPLAACGGRDAMPVMVAQYGDSKKTCDSLEFEMTTIQSEIQRLMPNRDKTGKNVALGVAGYFLLVPWFFMDFKNAEAQEYEAFRQRYNHLATIAIDKRCDVSPQEYMSIQKMQKEYEKAKMEAEKAKKTSND